MALKNLLRLDCTEVADAAQGIVIGQPVRMTNQHSSHARSAMNPRHAAHVHRAVGLQGVEDLALNGFPGTGMGGRVSDDYVTVLGLRVDVGTFFLQRFPKAGDDQLHMVLAEELRIARLGQPTQQNDRPSPNYVGGSGLPPWPGRSQRAMPKRSKKTSSDSASGAGPGKTDGAGMEIGLFLDWTGLALGMGLDLGALG